MHRMWNDFLKNFPFRTWLQFDQGFSILALVTLGQISPWLSVHCRMFNSIPGFLPIGRCQQYPAATPPLVMTTKNVSKHRQVSLGGKLSLLLLSYIKSTGICGFLNDLGFPLYNLRIAVEHDFLLQVFCTTWTVLSVCWRTKEYGDILFFSFIGKFIEGRNEFFISKSRYRSFALSNPPPTS